MRRRGGIPRRWQLALAAAMGAGVVALPALASSETPPSIEAVNVGLYSHYWSPSAVKVAPGGTVTLRNNSSTTAHGVEWRSALKPVCEEGAGKVPVGTSAAASGTKWSGACTFTQPGVYTFYCTVHGAEMSGSITVEAPGSTESTTTTTTTTAPPPTVTTGPSPTPVTDGGEGLLQALHLASRQRGGSVRGSLILAQGAAGGHLEIDLLRNGIRVGRIVRSQLRAESMSFAVPLTSHARHTLHRRGRLSLIVKVVLTPVSGEPIKLTRPVSERR